jgi:hypothetical protein
MTRKNHFFGFLLLLVNSVVAHAGDAVLCQKHMGSLKDPMMFGSTEQILAMQEILKGDCSQVWITYQPRTGVSKEIKLDLHKGVMLRTSKTAVGFSWEAWEDVQKHQILRDDASDGWDLKNYSSGRSAAIPARLQIHFVQ